MTWTIKNEVVQTDNGNFYIYISQDKFENDFKVGIARELEPGICGHSISELRYATLSKAKRRYAYLKREARKGRW